MTVRRGAFLVLLLASAAYATSVGNGFAYDDESILSLNPLVHEGDARAALTAKWWPIAREGAGLYRPVTLTSFVLEWQLFQGSPAGFHLLNVLVHAMVSLTVFLLLLSLGSLPGAVAGGALFAVHPLHTEAVANVVGRAELYAALFYLLACVLFWKGRDWGGGARVGRLLGLGALYALSLGGKEIGVTLPAALLLLEAARTRLLDGPAPPFLRRLLDDLPVWLLLAAVLGAYLGARFLVLGTVVGEGTAPVLAVVGSEARVFTALAIWVQYARLLLFPLDLASDYDPGVLFPSETFDPAAALGTLILLALGVGAWKAWRRAPLVSMGILWFGVTVLPVSNLLFSTGVLLAERTLYLPSVGLSLVVAGCAAPVLGLAPLPRRVALAGAVVALLLLTVRTTLRNPAWMDSFVVQQTLDEHHPESWRALRARAQGLQRVGEVAAATEVWETAVALAPTDYTLRVQAGDFHGRMGSWALGEAHLRTAIALAPEVSNAYQILAEHLIRKGFGREGHRVALEGLAWGAPDARLWALVSESYLLKGDLSAAIRAREAALAVGPGDAGQWLRLAEIQEAAGDSAGARRARARAQTQGAGPTGPQGGTP